ncbi:MAG: histidinol dehydrogenase [Candidatus Vidania fulgoroideorum]
MKIKIYKKNKFNKIYKKKNKNNIKSKNIINQIKEIVKKKKYKKIFKLINKLDKINLKKKRFVINIKKLKIKFKTKKKIIIGIKKIIYNIINFHLKQKKNIKYKTWKLKNKLFNIGQIAKPINNIAIYVPGGNKSYISSLIMNIIPAKIAGNRNIYVCTPSKGKNLIYLIYISKILGVKKIFRIGGAQAILTLTIGNKFVKNVDKIVGPGNIFVNKTKKYVYGKVGIESLAGPTELLIITNKNKNSKTITIDIFSQLEHDINSKVFLISNKIKLLKNVKKHIKKIKIKNKIIKKSIKNLFIILCKNIKECFKLSNKIAPEHLELICNKKYTKYIKNAGSVFVGKKSTEVFGDYAIGTNHVLPTNSNSRFSSPLGIYDFIKWINYIEIHKKGIKKISKYSCLMSKIERMFFHYKSSKKRDDISR